MSKPLIYTLVAYECAKHHLRPERINRRINDAIEKHVPDELEKQPCTKDLLCQRERAKHRKGCIGEVLPFEEYAEGLETVD
jgi:hypothetical protein